MEAKKLYFMQGGMNMDKLIDIAMTRLFQLAEYVCGKTAIQREENDACTSSLERKQARLIIKCSSVVDEPAASQKVAPTIRFSQKDYVEGELFSE